MPTALDAHYPSPHQAERVADPDVTDTKQLHALRSCVQPPESDGTLIGSIAHDFNNVLNSILMSARLLQMDGSEREQHCLLKVIQASAERGAAVVKRLLALADQTDAPVDPFLERFLRTG